MSASKKIPDFVSCFFLHTSFAYCLKTGVIQLTVTFLFTKQGQLDCVSWSCCNSGRQHWMITSDELPTNTKLECLLSKHYFITWMKWKWMEGEKKQTQNILQVKNLNNLAMLACIPTLQFVRERWNSRGRPSYITSFVNTLTRSKAAGWSFYSGKQLHRSSTDSMEKQQR